MLCANVTSAALCALSAAGALGVVAAGVVADACVSVPELLHALSVTTAANATASAALNRLVCTRTPCSSDFVDVCGQHLETRHQLAPSTPVSASGRHVWVSWSFDEDSI
jgi:hypothetical protein